MNIQSRPIGIFDSGVGGLSVYQHLRALLPFERFLYFADTAHVPYGEKSSEEIATLSIRAVEWLIKEQSKLIIIACNSASAHALPLLRARFDIPIVGLVPALKPATMLTKSKKIAVLATKATLNGDLLKEVIESYAEPQQIEVLKHFEPSLVPWVESGMPIDHRTATLLIKQMYAWLEKGVDTLVLGCTHYPFFRDFLEAEIVRHQLPLTLIDSGYAIAQRTQAILEHYHLSSNNNTYTPLQFYASGNQLQTYQTATRLINETIDFYCINDSH